MPFKRGKQKTGGRQAGVIPKAKIIELTAKDILAKCGLDPIAAMARIAEGDVPCGVCFGKGRTKFQPAHRKQTRICQTCDGKGVFRPAHRPDEAEPIPCPTCGGEPYRNEPENKLAERTCQSCYGSGKENVSPELRGKMLTELANYVHPKLKAVEHTGKDGGPIDNTMRLVFVEAKDGKPA